MVMGRKRGRRKGNEPQTRLKGSHMVGERAVETLREIFVRQDTGEEERTRDK